MPLSGQLLIGGHQLITKDSKGNNMGSLPIIERKLTITGKDGLEINPGWGKPDLSLAEKVYGWNTFEVLAFECGNPAAPVNAIPARAWARCHVRFVADTDPDVFIPALREHLDAKGFSMVDISPVPNNFGQATRMDPENPWVKFTTASFEKTLDKKVAFLPNLGGTLPNDAFSHILGMPTVWVPHPYGGCSQHAPNEHIMGPHSQTGASANDRVVLGFS